MLQPAHLGGTDGDGLPQGFSIPDNLPEFVDWVKQVGWDTVVGPKTKSMIDCLKEEGVQRFVVIGFCWGAWAACRTAAAFPDCVVGTGGAHPSLKIETMHDGGNTDVFKGNVLANLAIVI